MSIVELGIKKPVTTLMLIFSVFIFALISIRYIPVELYPNYEFGEISVISHLRGGVPASEVEKYVTRPMEEIFSEVNGVKEITSASREAESVIVLKFYPRVNLDFAILEIREKLATIRHRLPREMERPIIAKFQQSDIPIVIISLSSDFYTPEQLREICEQKIKESFLRINGVANVEISGGRERKILIEIDNNKLVGYNLPILSVVEKINLSNISISAGDIEKADNRLLIRATGEYSNVEEIKDTAVGVTEKGSIIRLGEIATVKDSFYEPSSFARLNLRSVVNIYIQKETTANTLSVAENVIKEIEKLKKMFKNEIMFTLVKNDAEFIKSSILSLWISLVFSGLLVGVVLMVFLRSFKSIFVIMFTIPISLCISVILIYFSKLSFNIMTLSGLGLGVGMIVDNGIIIIQNIALHSKKEKDKDKTTLIINSTKELFLPIFASTLTTIIVFLPLVFLEPEVKKLYTPFGLAITYSLLASLIGSVILVPYFVHKLFKKIEFEEQSWEKKLVKYFINLLKFVFRNSEKILLITLVLIIFAIYIISNRESEFMETTEIDTFRIGIQFPPATKLERSNEIVKEIEKELLKYPQVERVTSKVEKLHTFIEVKVKKDIEYVKEDFRGKFDKFMPAFLYYPPSQSLTSKQVFVDLYGYDYGILKQLAFLCSGRIGRLGKVTDVKIHMRMDEPEIIVNVDRNKLASLGLSTLYFANILHCQLRGLVATYYRIEGRELETVCRLIPGSVSLEEELRRLRFVTPYGDTVAINQVANINKVDTQQEIWRKNKKRFIQISGNRYKAGLSTVVKIINNELKKINFPKDYTYKFSGDYEDMMKNKKQFSLALVLTCLLVYMTLAAMFESYLQPFIIILSIPYSLIGVALFLWLFKKPISLGVWIGLMMLCGIVVNSAIVIVEKMNIYKREKRCNLLKLILATPKTYLLETLMASITTIFGMLPLILNPDKTSVMWRTLGLTIFGGMLVATFLVLFLTPLIYFWFEKFSKSDIKKFVHRFKLLPNTNG